MKKIKEAKLSLHLFTIFIMLLSSPQRIWTQENDRPNILWLTSEDNSADWLGCYGNSYAETPNIDKLAEEGFQYMNAYANAPACSPSRSTWITGVMAVSMGTHPQRSRYNIPHDQIKYYPDLLNDVDYFTGNFDKTDYNIGGRNDKDCWNTTGNVDFDNLKNQQPFFQVINSHKSHESRIYGDLNETLHNPDSTVLRRYHPDLPIMRKTYAQYYDSIKAMDSEIGAALDKLEKAGLAENTIVIYTSDHGGVMPRSKRYLHRNSLQCPLIVRIPKKYKTLWPAEKPGRKIDRLVSFVDMPKTWINLAGGIAPKNMQGTIFLGEKTEPEPEYHFAFRGRMEDGIDNSRALNDKRFLYIRNYMPYAPWMQYHYWVWAINATRSWEKAVHKGNVNSIQSQFFKPKGTEELYDMVKDPDCTKNLINNAEYKAVAVKMRQEMRKQQIEINDAGLLPETEMNRLAKKHNTTIYQLAHNPEIYNVKTLLNSADLALDENPKNLPRLRNMLESKNIGMRYWGMIGCFLLNDKEAGLKGINDDSHEIRAMAAWLLMRTDKKEIGLNCLEKMIGEKGSFWQTNEPSYAILSILNMVDWMGEDGKVLMNIIRKQEFDSQNPKFSKDARRVRDHLIEKFSRY